MVRGLAQALKRFTLFPPQRLMFRNINQNEKTRMYVCALKCVLCGCDLCATGVAGAEGCGCGGSSVSAAPALAAATFVG